MKQTPETTPPINNENFVRRIRVLPSGTGTRLGMDQATARELVSTSGLLDFVSDRATQSRVAHVPEAEMTTGAYSPVQIEIQPPLDDDELRRFGRMCVDGTIVPGWSPLVLDIPREGVEVTDFRRGGLPSSDLDRGQSMECLGSSLHYISGRALDELNLAG